MGKRRLARQVRQLVAEHAPDRARALDKAVADANADARRLTGLVAAGASVVAVVVSVVAFLITMGDDLDQYGSETLPFIVFSVPLLFVPAAALTVGLVMTNRRAFAHTLSQLLAEQGVLDQVPQAGPLLRAQPLKTLYQATWVVVTVVLVVFGALWAAVVSMATASALAAAKDPKSM